MYIDLSKISSGFSDKLRVITFFIALSKFKKINQFLIYEKKNFQCPFRFVDLCKIKDIKIKIQKKNIHNKKNIIFSSYNSEITKKNCVSANKFSDKIDSEKLFTRWRDSYKHIQPIDFLKKKIKKINLPKKYIAIHIRSTDRVVKLKNIIRAVQLKDMILENQINLFPNEIFNFIKKYSNCKNIYISSDQQNLKKKIINKLSNKNFKVFYNNSKYNNNSYRKTSGEDFLVDLFCLSKSKIIFSTVGGGVPLTAQLLNNKKAKVVNWSNELNKFIFQRILILTIYYLKRLKNFFK